MAYDAIQLCQRYDELKGQRGTFESHWEEIAENIYTRRMGFVGERTVGEKRTTKIYDGTPLQALELLAAGLHGMATNPASRWFSLRIIGEDAEDDNIREYLSAVEDRLFSEMHSPSSSITTHLHELYMDYAAFGTGIMFIGKTKEDKLLFQTRSLAECMIDENAEGVVDTVIRKFKMSVRQCFQKWGDKCPKEVKDKYAEGKFTEPVEILHAVCPREERESGKKDAMNMPFASVYLDYKSKETLSESGFEEFPYAVPRWYKVTGETYGRSPGMSALPDCKMLHSVMKDVAVASQLAVRPPLNVPDEGHIGPVRTIPGGLNFYRGEREISPMMTGVQPAVGLDFLQDLRNRVLSTFFVDQLQMVGDADMTATEVMQRTQERMRLLGPILGRMESELLGPLIARVFGILSRLERLPEQPEELDGVEWTVEYTSPIALAQRGQKVELAMRWLMMMGGAAQGIPSVGQALMKRFDGEGFIEWSAREMSVDPALIIDEDDVQEPPIPPEMVGMAAEAAKAYQAAGQGSKAFSEAVATGQQAA